MQLAPSGGNVGKPNHDWFWFYFWLVKKSACALIGHSTLHDVLNQLQNNITIVKTHNVSGFSELCQIGKFSCCFVFQDLPFPSPLESALTMGNLCAYSEGLPIHAADLCALGINVLLWAQNYAQTSTDLRGVRRINRMYDSRKEVTGDRWSQ